MKSQQQQLTTSRATAMQLLTGIIAVTTSLLLVGCTSTTPNSLSNVFPNGRIGNADADAAAAADNDVGVESEQPNEADSTTEVEITSNNSTGSIFVKETVSDAGAGDGAAPESATPTTTEAPEEAEDEEEAEEEEAPSPTTTTTTTSTEEPTDVLEDEDTDTTNDEEDGTKPTPVAPGAAPVDDLVKLCSSDDSCEAGHFCLRFHFNTMGVCLPDLCATQVCEKNAKCNRVTGECLTKKVVLMPSADPITPLVTRANPPPAKAPPSGSSTDKGEDCLEEHDIFAEENPKPTTGILTDPVDKCGNLCVKGEICGFHAAFHRHMCFQPCETTDQCNGPFTARKQCVAGRCEHVQVFRPAPQSCKIDANCEDKDHQCVHGVCRKRKVEDVVRL